MLDFNLQMRFWRSVTDALIYSTDAAFAAAAAWQDEVLASAEKPSVPASQNAAVPANPWAWWLGGQSLSTAAMPAWPAPMWPMAAFLPDFWRPAAVPVAFAPAFPGAAFGGQMPFWPWPVAWASMQMPLTVMMVSAGVPYAIASPSAKAGTAVMDAADAAREQMGKIYSAYRSDGGHASAQLAALPFRMAATFAAIEPPKARSPGW